MMAMVAMMIIGSWLCAVFARVYSFAGNMRDWNEEYQACKELPSGTVQERIIRDRAVLKVHNDFVDAATRGAMYVHLF
jgi:hypothetical protein